MSFSTLLFEGPLILNTHELIEYDSIYNKKSNYLMIKTNDIKCYQIMRFYQSVKGPEMIC